MREVVDYTSSKYADGKMQDVTQTISKAENTSTLFVSARGETLPS